MWLPFPGYPLCPVPHLRSLDDTFPYESFVFFVSLMLSRLCWERAVLLALVGDVYCIFVTFPCGILGQVWYLIVLFPDLCHLSYFKCSHSNQWPQAAEDNKILAVSVISP